MNTKEIRKEIDNAYYYGDIFESMHGLLIMLLGKIEQLENKELDENPDSLMGR